MRKINLLFLILLCSILFSCRINRINQFEKYILNQADGAVINLFDFYNSDSIFITTQGDHDLQSIESAYGFELKTSPKTLGNKFFWIDEGHEVYYSSFYFNVSDIERSEIILNMRENLLIDRYEECFFEIKKNNSSKYTICILERKEME